MAGIRGAKNFDHGTTVLHEDSLNPRQLSAGNEDVTGDAGVISTSVMLTQYTTGGAEGATLADGAYEGQQKVITLISDGGNLTVTPAHFVNGTTLVLSADYDCAILTWTSGGWLLISSTPTTVTVA